MAPLRQLTREQPDIFWIVDKIPGQVPPGHFSFRWCVAAMFGSSDCRGTVRQIGIVALRAGPPRRRPSARAKDNNKQAQLSCPAHGRCLMPFLGSTKWRLSHTRKGLECLDLQAAD